LGLVVVGTLAGQTTVPDDWPMYNRDVFGTRFNAAERKLSPSTVAGLRLRWSFPTTGNVNATPLVVGTHIYAGDTSGKFYALAEDIQSPTGVRQLWATQLQAPVTATALALSGVIVIGDQAGLIYGLDRQTGTVLWNIRPNPHPLTAIYGSATPVGGNDFVIGISSNEEDAAETPNSGYPCCSFRGSVARINALTGNVIWHTYMISLAQQQSGSAGAAVWSTPTFDPATNTIYVTTSDNYSPPATDTGEAIIALDASSGAFRWVRTFRVGNGVVPDADFGDSPQIYNLPSGQKVVGAGQKSGTFHVVDAVNGASVGDYPALPLCVGTETLGLFSDSAVADGVVYANGTDCFFGGVLIALRGDGSGELWRFSAGPAAPALSGVAVANGVVYFQVFGVSITGPVSTLYALNMKTGAVLGSVSLNTAAISGPAIANGRIVMGTGVNFPPFVQTAGGSIVAFSLLPGDLNGDAVVNCADVSIVRSAFGNRAGQPGFDPRADVVADGVIDIRDLAFVSQRLPLGTRCQ
jgi:polyvinyl alcohol dehydrogenase (cytochrome)